MIRISKNNLQHIVENVGAGAMGGAGSGAGMAPLTPGGSAYGAERPGDCRMPPGCTPWVVRRKKKVNEAEEIEDIAEILVMFKLEKDYKEFLATHPEWENVQVVLSGAALEDRGKIS